MSDYDSNNFNVDLSNYQGPLDILLELAKKQNANARWPPNPVLVSLRRIPYPPDYFRWLVPHAILSRLL